MITSPSTNDIWRLGYRQAAGVFGLADIVVRTACQLASQPPGMLRRFGIAAQLALMASMPGWEARASQQAW